LMHGGPGADHWSLLPFRRLSDQLRLVFYDHRCNGRSTGAPIETMTWANLTADADVLREKLGIERWAVLGHSFGGMVALEYALRYPESLSHLILLDTGGDNWWPSVNGPRILARRGYSASTVRLAKRFFSGRIEPREMQLGLLRFGSAYYYRPSPLTIAREIFHERHTKVRPEALIFGQGTLTRGWSVMDRLGSIETPTLVMAGRDDFLFPVEHQLALAAGLPSSRLEIIERAGHNAHSERPAEVMRAVRDFLETGNGRETDGNSQPSPASAEVASFTAPGAKSDDAQARKPVAGRPDLARPGPLRR